MPSQLHVSCETKAQVTTEADVEQGWCLGWGERNASQVFLSLLWHSRAFCRSLRVISQCCFGLDFQEGRAGPAVLTGLRCGGWDPHGGLRPHLVQVLELLCFHSGSHLGRPDLLPRTLPVDEANSDSVATTLSTSSLGSGGLHSPANR